MCVFVFHLLVRFIQSSRVCLVLSYFNGMTLMREKCVPYCFTYRGMGNRKPYENRINLKVSEEWRRR